MRKLIVLALVAGWLAAPIPSQALTVEIGRSDRDYAHAYDYYQGRPGNWYREQNGWYYRDNKGDEYRQQGNRWAWYNGRYHGVEGQEYHNRNPQADRQGYNAYQNTH